LAVVARDNDRVDNGKGGDPPVPNDAAASGGGDDDNASTRMRSGRGTTDGGGGGHHCQNDDDAEEGRHIIAGTTTTMDTDAATIAAGTTPQWDGEGEEGVVASSGRRSRACVDFGHRRGRLLRRHRPSSTSAIVAAVNMACRGHLRCQHWPSLTWAIVAAVDEWLTMAKRGGTNLIIRYFFIK
jgi:hypothetical protein